MNAYYRSLCSLVGGSPAARTPHRQTRTSPLVLSPPPPRRSGGDHYISILLRIITQTVTWRCVEGHAINVGNPANPAGGDGSPGLSLFTLCGEERGGESGEEWREEERGESGGDDLRLENVVFAKSLTISRFSIGPDK
ncbi:hypothetical protein E2C01_044534 [Portunus trituberculatus]|uniref:Uncharacterized protein n=1 Tax=Portunus trituberculatus TaxID=210409 RepID=A0A5B7G0B5_PORTR|nr:hypothetical protein [Portunus trituberculatus]